jgi:hypothetical protein
MGPSSKRKHNEVEGESSSSGAAGLRREASAEDEAGEGEGEAEEGGASGEAEDEAEQEARLNELLEKYSSQQKLLLEGVSNLEADIKPLLKATQAAVSDARTQAGAPMSRVLDDLAVLQLPGPVKELPSVVEVLSCGDKIKSRAQEAVMVLLRQWLMLESRLQALKNVRAELNQWDFRSNPLTAVTPDLPQLLARELAAQPVVTDDMVRASPYWKDWKSTIGKLDVERSDDDVEVAGDKESFPRKCAITMCDLLTPPNIPVRSRKCKHIFSDAGIKALFAQVPKGQQMKCPTPGCSAMSSLSEFEASDSLIKDSKWRAESGRHALAEPVVHPGSGAPETASPRAVCWGVVLVFCLSSLTTCPTAAAAVCSFLVLDSEGRALTRGAPPTPDAGVPKSHLVTGGTLTNSPCRHMLYCVYRVKSISKKEICYRLFVVY